MPLLSLTSQAFTRFVLSSAARRGISATLPSNGLFGFWLAEALCDRVRAVRGVACCVGYGCEVHSVSYTRYSCSGMDVGFERRDVQLLHCRVRKQGK